ncbi:MAG: hypothetical protein WKG07_12640 [Hymenobacter sp.]
MFFDESKFMDGQIRYETIRNLFYDNNWSREVAVIGKGIGATRLRKQKEQVEVVFGDGRKRLNKNLNEITASIASQLSAMNDIFPEQQDNNLFVNFKDLNHLRELVNKDGSTSNIELSNPQPTILVKKYAFQKQILHGKSHNNSFLRPPFGENLMEVLQAGPSVFRKKIGAFFTQNGYNLTLRTEEQKLEITKTLDGLTTAIPYSLIADTLQRLIFLFSCYREQ